MTRRELRRVFCAFIIFVAAVGIQGCGSASRQQFGMSFLPPSPTPPAAFTETTEPPRIAAIQPNRELPASFRPTLDFPPRPSTMDPYLRRSESHFQTGKRLYQNGDMEGARKEFDRAIDILMDAPEDTSEAHLIEKRYDKLVESIYRLDVESLGSGETQQEPVFDRSPLESILELTFPINPGIKKKVREEILGTLSQLPLQENDAVLSYINFFSSERGRRILESGLRRSGRYRDMISRILAEEGVPQELIFVAQAESGFLPRAVSRKAAVGMWQFIQARGREYGLLQSNYADDRLDPEKATRAAARHLRDLYEQLGDWYLAIAGYNCGPGNVLRGVQKTGYADFWELRSRSALPKETANYVPIILAMTIMVKNARDYGLDMSDFDRAVEYETIRTDAPTSLALIADAADRPVSEIRELNPALLRNLAPERYEVRVPKGTAETTLATLQMVPEQHRAGWRLHRVDGSETLASIAKQYGTSVSSINAANREASELTAGSRLLIPAVVRESRVEKKTARTASGRSNAHRSKATGRATAKSKPVVKRGTQVASLRHQIAR